MIIGTILCANYLPRGIALARSIRRHMPEAKIVLWLLEKQKPVGLDGFKSCFDSVALVKDAVNYNLEYFIFRHSIVEASTAVKGDLLRWLLDQYPQEDKFAYMDPDTMIFSSFVEIETLLEEHAIILTPHQLSSVGHIAMEMSSLEHGIYNLGFLAFRRGPESEAMIAWFTKRLHLACFDAKHIGLFTDQKWFNLVPLFFRKVHVLTHAGYNVGPWNLMSRAASEVGGTVRINGDELRFMHFSGFPQAFLQCIHLWARGSADCLLKLCERYQGMLNEVGKHGFQHLKWTYGNYESGEVISLPARLAWRSKPFSGAESPFRLSNRRILGIWRWLISYPLERVYRKFRGVDVQASRRHAGVTS